MTIHPDNNFELYSQVLVDGETQNITCTKGCTVILPDRNKNSTVDAYNIWGGKASQTFDIYNSAPQNTYMLIARLLP